MLVIFFVLTWWIINEFEKLQIIPFWVNTLTVWSAEHETILASLLEKAQQYTASEWPVKDNSSLPDWLSHTFKEMQITILQQNTFIT